MKKITHLNDLMIEQLRDLYQGAKQLEAFLPDVVKDAVNGDLVRVLAEYQRINEAQIMRIRQAFEVLFVQKRGETSHTMTAMVKETEELIERCQLDEVRDAALITRLQHIIHYQIAGYGAICTYSQMLDFENIAEIIHLNLAEEKAMDQKLISLAEKEINKEAI